MIAHRLSGRLCIAATALLFGLTQPSASSPPIRIGGSLSLTGSYAPFGQTQHRGVQLCIKHANATSGVLGRPIELLVQDDQSRADTAVRIYRTLISDEKVDAVIGPYSSTITEAVADLTERHKLPMLASGAASSSLVKKGRRFLFLVMSPTDVYFEGLIDLAVSRGLKTIAFVYQDAIFPRSTVEGGKRLAMQKGLEIVAVESYPKATSDFSGVMSKIQTANPDVLAAGTYFNDVVAITRTLEHMDINPRMFGATVGVHLPKFYQTLGAKAEFVYGATQWEPQLINMRAGGLIPIAREYPGVRRFVTDYEKEFPGANYSHLTAAAYAGCQILLEGIKKANSLHGKEVRDAIASLDINTVYGAFRVDERGFQVAHKMMLFQWQAGKKVIVWPRILTSQDPLFPTPAWTQR